MIIVRKVPYFNASLFSSVDNNVLVSLIDLELMEFICL
jgi:hypothetical protein